MASEMNGFTDGANRRLASVRLMVVELTRRSCEGTVSGEIALDECAESEMRE